MLDTEEKIKSEATSSSIRFLVILFVIILAGAGVFYWVLTSEKPLDQAQATTIMKAILSSKGPATVQFRVGDVQASIDVKPSDPHYALLEKAGYLKLSGRFGGGKKVEVTPAGEQLFAQLNIKQAKEADGTQTYTVPLATKELVSVDKVAMISTSAATVNYTWKWVPNRVGDDFDANGKLAQGFNNWDRAKLIEKGVDFYHGAPSHSSINLVRGSKGWVIQVE